MASRVEVVRLRKRAHLDISNQINSKIDMMSTKDHNHNSKFASTLKEVYNELSELLTYKKPTAEIVVARNGVTYIGVWNGLRNDFDTQMLRSIFRNLLQLEDFRMIQVIGDSGRGLSIVGVEKAEELLRSLVDEDVARSKQTILEYGYTASEHDANWIVNDLIASIPELQLRTMANVVYQSAVAVEEWGSTATGKVRNFVLAYDEYETVFGDDTWLSDLVMTPSHGDVVVCLEGGPQTFAQVATLCSLGVSIIAMTGSKMRKTSSCSESARFSASHMLRILCDNLHNCADETNPTPKEKTQLKVMAIDYLDCLEEFQTSSNRSKYDRIRLSLDLILDRPMYLSKVAFKYMD